MPNPSNIIVNADTNIEAVYELLHTHRATIVVEVLDESLAQHLEATGESRYERFSWDPQGLCYIVGSGSAFKTFYTNTPNALTRAWRFMQFGNETGSDRVWSVEFPELADE